MSRSLSSWQAQKDLLKLMIFGEIKMDEVCFVENEALPLWFAKSENRFVSSTVYRQWITNPNVWSPPTDVYDTAQSIIVRVEIAGMRDAEFSISIDNRMLVIHGVRPDLNEKRAYHQMEIRSGEFISIVELPVPVVVDAVDADYNDGFLSVVLPKESPKKINVE
jgi:HSP20 family protein